MKKYTQKKHIFSRRVDNASPDMWVLCHDPEVDRMKSAAEAGDAIVKHYTSNRPSA